jgi:transposase
MTEEEARKIEQENTELKEQLAQKDRRREELEARLMGALLRMEELERRQRKDSHNSSKPPSSDGLDRKPRAQRKKSGLWTAPAKPSTICANARFRKEAW